MSEQNHEKDYEQELEEKYEGLLPDCIVFAANAHAGQYRKISSHPYIIHPLRVSEFILKNFAHRKDVETLRMIAILHDTIEDTWVSSEKIKEEFGEHIAKRVVELSVAEIGNKVERHQNYMKLLEVADDQSKIVKLADMFDNVITTNGSKWIPFLNDCKDIIKILHLKKPDEKFEIIKSDLNIIIDKKLIEYG